GEELSATDYENLKNLYNANAALKTALLSAMRGMNGDYDFSEMGKAFEGNALLSNFDRLQELSVEYPELIYDGPFSDGRDAREIKGLSGEKITSREAEEIFIGCFSEYSPKNVQSVGKSTGSIAAFCVQAEIKGETAYAQISEIGGKLIMYAYAGSCGAVNYERYYLTEKALDFLEKSGMENMRAVWVNLNNNVYTINFAPEISGAIIYPDLVKVRLCAETGMIIGLEATGYYTNHTERAIATPILSASQARAKVSDDIATETVRLAVVPVGDSAEKLCYEFSGDLNGETYYVYIDVFDGRQVEMFKVIESEEGSLLM
ncbi:MAG: germination protein YpeB, partial [Clostridia bacterium]|nr:germination protein YpeB [Clostridia bacterium]